MMSLFSPVIVRDKVSREVNRFPIKNVRGISDGADLIAWKRDRVRCLDLLLISLINVWDGDRAYAFLVCLPLVENEFCCGIQRFFLFLELRVKDAFAPASVISWSIGAFWHPRCNHTYAWPVFNGDNGNNARVWAYCDSRAVSNFVQETIEIYHFYHLVSTC